MSTIRQQVFAMLVEVSRAAAAEGKDGLAEIMRRYPRVPAEVAAEAWCQACALDVEDWWQSVEMTIEVETVRQALLTVPLTEFGASSNSSDFLETSIVWSIYHLRDALVHFNANRDAEFRSAIRKFGACAKALLDTVPEVRL